MNSVSWFLYLADALGSLGMAAMLIGVLFFLVGLLGYVAHFIASGQYIALSQGSSYQKEKAKEWEDWIMLWKPFKKGLVAGFALIVVSCLLPAKETFYAIAASELGEKLVTSEAVRGVSDDATKALRSWLKKQIEPEVKEKK